MVILIIILVLVLLFGLYLLALGGRNGTDMSEFKKYDFAHRGLFRKGVIPENSISAFKNAVKNCYGAELDVHLLADGNLAVIHDASLKRTANSDKKIYELRRSDLKDYNLENTSDTIPDFKEVLNIFEYETPIIIELKVDNGNYRELCNAVCNALENYGGLYCIESFDPRCIRWFKKNRPDVIRGLLSKNYLKQSEIKNFWFNLFLTSLVSNFLYKPDFIAYRESDREDIPYKLCRKIWKIKGVSWTVDNQNKYDEALKNDEIRIFEGFIPRKLK